MKNKYIRTILSVLAVGVVLAGCSDKASKNVTAETDTGETTSDGMTDNGASDGTLNDSVIEIEDDGDDTASNIVFEEEEDSGDVQQTADTGISFTGKPENNGAHFVKLDDRVFFRVPDKEGLDVAGLFGEYIDTESGPTKLVSHDTKTGETKEVFDDHGYRGIFIKGSTMSLNEWDNSGDSPIDRLGIYDMNSDFAAKYSAGEMVMKGAADGSVVVTGYYDGDKDGYMLHAYLEDGQEYDVDESHVMECIACDKNRLYYTTFDFETGDHKLFEYDYSSRTSTELGDIPSDANEGGTGDPGEVKDAVCDDGGVYFSQHYYQGTGHFISSVFYVTARAGEKGSLKSEEADVNFEEEDDNAPFVVLEEGKIDKDVDGIPLGASYAKGDVLVWYDNEGKAHEVPENESRKLSTKRYETDDDGNMVSEVECIEYVDGILYGIYNELERSEADDIGWRMAYRRTKTSVFSVDVNSGEEKILYTVE